MSSESALEREGMCNIIKTNIIWIRIKRIELFSCVGLDPVVAIHQSPSQSIHKTKSTCSDKSCSHTESPDSTAQMPSLQQSLHLRRECQRYSQNRGFGRSRF